MEPWFRLFVGDVKFLTLAGTGHFESFHGARGWGWYDPLAVSPLIDLGTSRKNERVARHETKRMAYQLNVLGKLGF